MRGLKLMHAATSSATITTGFAWFGLNLQRSCCYNLAGQCSVLWHAAAKETHSCCIAFLLLSEVHLLREEQGVCKCCEFLGEHWYVLLSG